MNRAAIEQQMSERFYLAIIRLRGRGVSVTPVTVHLELRAMRGKGDSMRICKNCLLVRITDGNWLAPDDVIFVVWPEDCENDEHDPPSTDDISERAIGQHYS